MCKKRKDNREQHSGGDKLERLKSDVASGIATVVFMFFCYQAVMKIPSSDHPMYFIVLTIFNGLLVFIYMRRDYAEHKATDLKERLIPLLVTFGPIASFSFSIPNPDTVLVGNSIAILGISFCIWSLFYLSGNFSIFVEARKCVSGGPYRVIRHPVYAGEVTTFVGIAISAPSIFTIATVTLLVAGQLYRAWMEEAKLLKVFGDDYRSVQERAWWPLTNRI